MTSVEPMNNGKNRIIVTELPYMVNKAKLIEKMAELVKDKKIDGIQQPHLHLQIQNSHVHLQADI